jgi:drug/metabolite transporter (DMT)-like permease
LRAVERNITKSTVIGYIAAIIAAALFGSVSTIAKPVLDTVNPILLSSLVYLISAVVFTPIALGSNVSSLQTSLSVSKRIYLLVIATSIIGAAVAPAMFFFGLRQTTASDTSLLAIGETIFSIILAILFFKEKLRSLGYLAALMVLAGLVVVTTNLQFHSSLFEMNNSAGNLLVIGATALWGLDNNISRIITHHVKVVKLVQLKSVIGGSVLFIFAIFVLHIPLSINVIQLPQIVLLGAVGFGISLYFFLISMKRIGIVRSVLVLSFSSVFGIVFASFLLSEVVSLQQIIATVIMITGIYLISIEKR